MIGSWLRKMSGTSAPLTSMRWHTALLFGAASFLAFASFYSLPIGDEIERSVSRPVEFNVRKSLSKEPTFSERIKLICFDDLTLRRLGRAELTVDEWASLLEMFATIQPKALFIDKIFQVAFREGENLDRFKTALGKLPRTLVGAFVYSKELKNFDTLSLEREELQLKKYLRPGSSLKGLEWMYHSNESIYGPHQDLAPHFSQVGHILYSGRDRILPWYRLNSNPALGLPYVGFEIADKIELSRTGIKLDDLSVPLDRSAGIIPNLLSVQAVEKNSYSLAPFLKRAEKKLPLPDFFKNDDVILIFPTMYTGSGDIKSTAFGDYPGPYIHASVFNSVVTGNWLVPLPWSMFFIFVACLGGALCGYYFRPTFAVFFTLLGTSSIVALGLGLFVYGSLVLPWFFSGSAFMLTSLLVVAGRARNYERNAQRISGALQGLVAPAVMEKLFKNPESLNREPSEHVVTVMFVDIVGFSLAVETLTPQQVFVYLKDELTAMAEVVHKFGGVVDKTLGDGLLCFFGYNYDGSEDAHNHAMQALFCAEAIHRLNAQFCVAAKSKGLPASPLRIGINSGAVYLGNIGNNQRIDFTIIGHCVNYARRLEEACESFRVMLGPATKDLLAGIELIERATRRRDLHIKHHAELWEAFEYDPFYGEPELIKQAIQACRERQNFERKEPRWAVPPDFPVWAALSGIGRGRLVDFSNHGFAVEVNTYLAQKVIVNLTLESSDPEFKAKCDEHELSSIECEVRWGRPSNGQYQHGLLIRNLNPHQRELLLKYLREFMTGPGAQLEREMRRRSEAT